MISVSQKGIYSGEVENNKVIGYRFLGKYIFTLCVKIQKEKIIKNQ